MTEPKVDDLPHSPLKQALGAPDIARGARVPLENNGARNDEPTARTGKDDAVQQALRSESNDRNGRGDTALDALQQLTSAYRELPIKSGKTLTAAIQALSEAKSPIEFIGLQQKLVLETFGTAVNDGLHIARLIAAVLTQGFQRRSPDSAEPLFSLGKR